MKVDGPLPPWPTKKEVMTALMYHRKKYFCERHIPHVPHIRIHVKYRLKKLTTITNLDATAKALGVPTIYLMKYFSIKLGTLVYTKKGSIIIHGFHGLKKLQRLLKNFSREFVICPKSKIHGTDLIANEGDKLQQICRECSYKRHLDSTDKLVRFILRYKKKEVMNKQIGSEIPMSEERNLTETSNSDEKMAIVLKLIDSAVKSAKLEKTILSAIREISTQHTTLVRGGWSNLKFLNRKRYAKYKFMMKRGGINFSAAKHTFVRKRRATKISATIRKRLGISSEKKKRRSKFFENNISAGKSCLLGGKKRVNGPSAKNRIMGKKEKTCISANRKRKIFPKIRIENIPECYTQPNIIYSIKAKNPWIENLVHDLNDFKVVATLKTKIKGVRHLVVKCSPQIRKNLKACGDKLFVLNECVRIYDSYHVIRCSKCQEFGHTLSKCLGRLICPKCGKEHWIKACKSKRATCAYCQGRHITGDKSCEKYKEQEEKIKDATDHGEDEEIIKDVTDHGEQEQSIMLKGRRVEIWELLKSTPKYSKRTKNRK